MSSGADTTGRVIDDPIAVDPEGSGASG